VVLSDIKKPDQLTLKEGPYVYSDVTDLNYMNSIVVDNAIDWVVHYSALLSAAAEDNVKRALDVNVLGFQTILEVCHSHNLRLFCPSTIGAFGPSSPRNPTPDITIQRPRYIYGISKVYMELLGEYYHYQHGLDFRSLRYPGVISADAPGGGTTDYAIDIFYEAARSDEYNCFLSANTRLPMIHMADCIRATIEFIEAPSEKLKLRTYNITGMSFTPEELVKLVMKFYPHLKVNYVPDHRQSIADSWPQVFDDSGARNDWGWTPEFDLKKLVSYMVNSIDPETFQKTTL
jgi:threonine 3-dehydrogenase